MNLSAKAIDVLLNAERQLVSLANEASHSRDYDGATALLEAARRVKMVGDNGALSAPAVESPLSTAPINADANPSTPLPPAVRRVRKNDYPKFLCDGDALVKIGWSKAEKSEYEHKSPKKVLLSLCRALVEAGAKGRRFSMDKLFPLTDSDDASQLPTYQCYLCLAWLRHEGLVVQHGRQGYSLPKNGDLPSAIERIWAQLPVRS